MIIDPLLDDLALPDYLTLPDELTPSEELKLLHEDWSRHTSNFAKIQSGHLTLAGKKRAIAKWKKDWEKICKKWGMVPDTEKEKEV